MRAGMNIYWTNINNKNIAFVWYKCLQWNSIFYAVKLRQEPLRDKPAMMMSHTRKKNTIRCTPTASTHQSSAMVQKMKCVLQCNFFIFWRIRKIYWTASDLVTGIGLHIHAYIFVCECANILDWNAETRGITSKCNVM